MSIHLDFTVFFQGFQSGLIAKISFLEIILLEVNVAEVEVAVGVEVVELDGILVRLHCLVIILQTPIGDTEEKEYLGHLLFCFFI